MSEAVVFCYRSKMSELLLECEEEELEPWQKQTSHVHVKVEDDVGELSKSQHIREHVGVDGVSYLTTC